MEYAYVEKIIMALWEVLTKRNTKFVSRGPSETQLEYVNPGDNSWQIRRACKSLGVGFG